MATRFQVGLIFVLLFSSGVTGGAKLGELAANALILHHVYGGEAIARQHLQIVGDKPHLHVSNGDVLNGYDFIHFLIVAAMFVIVGMLTLLGAALLILLALRQKPDRLTRRENEGPAWFPLFLFLPLAATMMFIHSLWPNAIGLGLGLGLCVAWSRAWSRPRWFASRIERV